jgi:hypothetical protein
VCDLEHITEAHVPEFFGLLVGGRDLRVEVEEPVLPKDVRSADMDLAQSEIVMSSTTGRDGTLFVR